MRQAKQRQTQHLLSGQAAAGSYGLCRYRFTNEAYCSLTGRPSSQRKIAEHCPTMMLPNFLNPEDQHLRRCAVVIFFITVRQLVFSACMPVSNLCPKGLGRKIIGMIFYMPNSPMHFKQPFDGAAADSLTPVWICHKKFRYRPICISVAFSALADHGESDELHIGKYKIRKAIL